MSLLLGACLQMHTVLFFLNQGETDFSYRRNWPEAHSVAKDDLGRLILLLPLPWDYKHAPPARQCSFGDGTQGLSESRQAGFQLQPSSSPPNMNISLVPLPLHFLRDGKLFLPHTPAPHKSEVPDSALTRMNKQKGY